MNGYQLSPQQLNIYLEHKIDSASSVMSVDINGALDVNALVGALNFCISSNESFRSTFIRVEGMKIPFQQVEENFDVWGVIERQSEGSNIPWAQWQQEKTQVAKVGFDSQKNSFIANIFCYEQHRHLLVCHFHPLVADRFSINSLFDQCIDNYHKLVAHKALLRNEDALQYLDYSEWVNELVESEESAAGLRYWRKELQVIGSASAPVIADNCKPECCRVISCIEPFTLSESLAKRLKKFADQRDVSINAILYSAWLVMHNRMADDETLVGSMLFDGRDDEDLHQTLGLIARYIPLSCRLDESSSFIDVVMNVDKKIHEIEPLQHLFHPSKLADTNSSLRTRFGYESYSHSGTYETETTRFTIVNQQVAGDSFDVKLLAAINADATDITMTIYFDEHSYDTAMVAYWPAVINSLLESLCEDENVQWRLAALVSEHDYPTVIAALNKSYLAAHGSNDIWAQIYLVAERYPAHIALEQNDRYISYSELIVAAEKNAANLLALGVKPGDVVAIFAQRTLDYLINILALLRIAATYLPLDPAYPRKRIDYMLAHSNAALVLIDSAGDSISVVADQKTCTFATLSAMAVSGEAPTLPVIAPDNEAYLIYTSGTTGQPKGVLVNHAALASHIKAARSRYDIGHEDRVFLSAPFSFDPSVEQFFTALTAGATCVLKGNDAWGTREITTAIIEQRLSVVNFPTAFARQLITDWYQNRPVESTMSLRLVIAGGDQMLPLTIRQWNELAMDGVQLLNAYGPTEAVVTTNVAKVDSNTINRRGDVSIGQSLSSRKIYIVDEQQRPLPPGYIGHLYIGGDSLASAYLHNPELTELRFLRDPFSGVANDRIYVSGDKAYSDDQGNIFFRGRNDDQLKFRGFRVEPAEVNHVLSSIKGIHDAHVATIRMDGTELDLQLVAYYVSDEPALDEVEIAHQLAELLPQYMQPGVIVRLADMPYLPNGKLNKKLLSDHQFLDAHCTTEDLAQPETPTEHHLLDICRELLQASSLGITKNFFTAGGHSLVAMRCLSRIRQQFNVEISIKDFYNFEHIRAMAARIDQLRQVKTKSSLPDIVSVNRTNPLPLSFAQERLLFITQLELGSANYNMQALFRLTGQVNVEHIKNAFAALLQRHEILRTNFYLVDDQSSLKIHDQVSLPWREWDFSNHSSVQQHQAIIAVATEDMRQSFDVSKDVLLRVGLIHLGGQDSVLMVNMHHIISDGWSVQIFGREFASLYNSLVQGIDAALPEQTLQYVDFANWQKQWLAGEVLTTQLAYWREHLNNLPTVHTLPLDKPRPAQQRFIGENIDCEISHETFKLLQDFSARHQLTLYMALHIVYSLVISRYSNSKDIAIGTVSSGRNHSDIEHMLGMFVNTLVIRTDLASHTTISSYVEHVKRVVLDAYENQDLPFEKIVEELKPERNLSHNPLIQILLVLQNIGGAEISLEGAQCERIHMESLTSKYDLTLTVQEKRETILCRWQYNADIFSAESIQAMAECFETLARSLCTADNQLLHHLPAVELSRLTAQELPGMRLRTYAKNISLVDAFEQQCASFPHNTAVRIGEGQLRYCELNNKTNQLANYLVDQGVMPGARVALVIERTLSSMVGLLAILKTGAAYVPIDAHSPSARVEHILHDAGIQYVLTQQSLNEQLQLANYGQVVCIDDPNLALVLDNLPENNLPQLSGPNSLAYVIYTSGSTGKPKGVMIEHHHVLRLFFSANNVYEFNANDVWTQFHSIAFDVSVWEIWGAFLHAATLIIPDQDTVRDSERFCHLLEQERVTVLSQTPSAFYILQEQIQRRGSSMALRYIVFGGEALNVAKLKPWFNLPDYQQATLVNMYGITETTVHLTHQVIRPEHLVQGKNLIGIPLDDMGIYIVNADGQLQPRGAFGEIYVGGDGVAKGYLNRAELTAERFIPNPFAITAEPVLYRSGDIARWLPDGGLEYLGREDDQVKIRGYRIELAEIESQLLQRPNITACVVTAEVDNDITKLVAYVCLDDADEVSGDAKYRTEFLQGIKNYLRGCLPEYMQPSAFRLITSMPVTGNGKIDKARLPILGIALEMPANALSMGDNVAGQLKSIWSQLLSVNQIDELHNFFELGGHSLLVSRLRGDIERSFNISLSLRELFANPTLMAQANLIRQSLQASGSHSPDVIVPVARDSVLPLTFEQAQLWMFDQIEQGSTVFNNIIPLIIRGRLDVEALIYSVKQLQIRHESLRTCFVVREGQVCQHIHDSANAYFEIVDISDFPAEQQHQCIREKIAEASAEILDLSSGPLLRCSFLRLGEQEHALVINIHHICVDGWSINILLNETMHIYQQHKAGQLPALAALPIQCADYAAWQQAYFHSGAFNESLDFWRQQLQRMPAVSEIPPDYPRDSSASYQGAISPLRLSGELSNALHTLAKESHATLFVVTLTAYEILLHMESGSADIIVGTDVANRNNHQTHGLIGFFVNQLALRSQLVSEQRINERIVATRARVINALTHQHIPFALLLNQLDIARKGGYSPIFQTKFYIDEDALTNWQGNGLSIEPVNTGSKSARLDFTVGLRDTPDGIVGDFVYNTRLYRPARVASLVAMYEILLAEMVANPQQTIAALMQKVLTVKQQREAEQRRQNAQEKIASFGKKPGSKNGDNTSLPASKNDVVNPVFHASSFGELVEAGKGIANLEELLVCDPRHLNARLNARGALLFRGFDLGGVENFERLSSHLIVHPVKDNAEHNPVEGSGFSQTPVNYSSSKTLLWHNENTYNKSWPSKIIFFCHTPAMQGGQTPLVDCAQLYQLLPVSVREEFANKGLQYVRRYAMDDGLGLGWTTIFNTRNRNEVEQKCREQDMQYSWDAQGNLTTRAIRPAIDFCENSNQPLWNNQLLHWHFSCLDSTTRHAICQLYTPEHYPRQCFYGDGSVIADEIVLLIKNLYQKLEYVFSWQKGDVLLLDNRRIAHGRKVYEGERKLFVAMGDLTGYSRLAREPRIELAGDIFCE